MKKVIYTGMILMFGALATFANPITNFKPYEQESTSAGTEEPTTDQGETEQGAPE